MKGRGSSLPLCRCSWRPWWRTCPISWRRCSLNQARTSAWARGNWCAWPGLSSGKTASSSSMRPRPTWTQGQWSPRSTSRSCFLRPSYHSHWFTVGDGSAEDVFSSYRIMSATVILTVALILWYRSFKNTKLNPQRQACCKHAVQTLWKSKALIGV